MGLSTVFTAGLLALRLFSLPATAAPSKVSVDVDVDVDASVSAAASSWWFANIDRQGTVAFSDSTDYKVFRSVADYGATGDGTTDDTDAINSAITDGNRCGSGCDSTTVTPAIIYFPPGTYLVSKPIIPYYYTQLIGDLSTVPTIKGAAGFTGIALIDADPYDDSGNNWYTNQNNFFRQIRNFKIDLTGMDMTSGTGIHWQVAQATSLQNIVFNMVQDTSEQNAQQGLFIDNGSGGFMSDLTFNGGKYGAFVGSQQFTLRNFVFNNCNTALYMNWNWVWTLTGFEINNCGIGVDMTSGDPVQTVGSIVFMDSTISNTPIGVATVYDPSQTSTNGSLIIDNVDMSTNVPAAVQNTDSQKQILAGNAVISSWVQGKTYTPSGDGQAVQDSYTAPSKPDALLDGSGRFFTKSKNQYADTAASAFVSVKGAGAKGDGTTDDTAAIQSVFDSIGSDQIVYFDHGAYLITDTVKIPSNVKIVGEIWALIMVGGDGFSDQANPKVALQVGQAGDTGSVEIQDIIIETLGPQPGAILMEWNVAGTDKGSVGMWDVHFRIGGSAGTELQSDTCSKTPDVTTTPDAKCFGSFMLMHITAQSTVYLENVWFWVSDHELDLADHNQINIYNGRGLLIESTKGAWLWGTASEHSVLSNYQLANAQNVFMGLIQTETAYMQGNPDATVPFDSNPDYFDPDFSDCTDDTCARTWGLRVQDSSDIFVYGGGLYSFFNNYAQECVDTNDCQDNIISIDGSSDVNLFGVSTKASVNMITLEGQSVALDSDNRNNFCAAVAAFATS